MKILYFTDDFSAENMAFAKRNHLTVRRASAYHDGDTLENCDAVCGDVPTAYADRYPLHDIDIKSEQSADDKPDTVAELKAALIELGVEIPTGAKKADLEALLAQAQSGGNE